VRSIKLWTGLRVWVNDCTGSCISDIGLLASALTVNSTFELGRSLPVAYPLTWGGASDKPGLRSIPPRRKREIKLNPYNHGIECKEQVAPHQPEGLKQSVVI